MSSRILASATLEIISNSLSQKSESDHRAFRVKNLLADEIAILVGLWDEYVAKGSHTGIKLVVASSLNGTIPSHYVADPGLSITWYRNNIKSGLVYLETEDQSDAQGLKNIFTLRDSNFLDGSFDSVAAPYQSVAELLTASAWKSVNSENEPPTLLLMKVEQVIRLVHRNLEPVPVRKFIQFTEEVCAEWHCNSVPKDGQVADAIVGRALWKLELFPDELWQQGGLESRRLRRLQLNARHADLRSSSGDLDQAVLIETTKAVEFRDQSGLPMSMAENQSWRKLCIDYITTVDSATLKFIPYGIFEQLFRQDTKGMQLGHRVWSDINATDASRIWELDQLDVVDGLNQRNQSDAEKLLFHVTESTEIRMLADLLNPQTRKMVERLASPPARTFENPMIEIARQLERRRAHSDVSEVIAKLHLELGTDPELAGPTLPLFAFLYGRSLKEASEASHESGAGCTLSVDEKLVSIQEPPPIRNVDKNFDGEEAESGELAWSELPLKIQIFNASGQIIETIDNILWKPESISHLAMFWLLVADDSSPVYRNLGGCLATEEMLLAGSDWMNPFVARITELSAIPEAVLSVSRGKNAFVDRIIFARKEFQLEASKSGLSVELINAYFDQWQLILEEARNDFVPNGARIPTVNALISADSIMFGDTFRLMLPMQPLRLRWIGSHLNASKQLLISLLAGKVSFATRDGDPYLDWLEKRSPHETPPIALAEDSEIIYPRSEKSWYEEYVRFDSGASSFDEDSLSTVSICQRIRIYLDTHPYKTDGLSVLLLLPSTDTLAADILDQLGRIVLKDDWRITITIAAPKNRWENIARAVERYQSSAPKMRRGELFPSHDLAFVEFERGNSLEDSIGNQKFDLGIVTHILNGSMQQQQNTEPVLAVPGKFDPLMDQTTQMVTSEGSGATSIIMKPRNPDAALESWGTLVVRSNRASPVSRTQPENTDFVELRLSFDDSARVFNVLHQCCHWVITLERHVSRKQLESLEAGAPDILSIMDGVGSNGLNTLVVSSRSGRELIESRLIRKLEKHVPPGQLANKNRKDLEQLAAAIYDETRRFAPHLALSAMGISRVTEEILGLAVARSVAEKLIPLPEGFGRSAWISLDEHSDWFGGAGVTRGDMCRFTFRVREDGMVALDVVSLEGKLRQSFDPHGVMQADLTRKFMHDVLSTEEGDDSRKKIDSKLWRERIILAVESCAEEAICDIGTTDAEKSKASWESIRHAFREGNYVLESDSAIYSICLWENQGESIDISFSGEVLIVRSSNSHILALVGEDCGPELATEYLDLILAKNGVAAKTIDTANHTSEKLDFAPAVVFSKIETAPAFTDDRKNLPKSAVIKKHMSQEELQYIYNEILACFSAHGVSVSAAKIDDVPVIEGPASILFKIRPGASVDPRKLYEKAVALKLYLKLEQEQNVGFDIDKGYVTVDVPKSADQRYFVDAIELWAQWIRPADALVALLGEDRTGNVVEVNFSSSNSPHLLIGGTTGSGKSEALNTILYGLVSHYSSQELNLLLVDPKGTELNGFESYPHLKGTIGFEDSDAINILKQGVQEMQARYLRFREMGVKSLIEHNSKVSSTERLPWWVIVLDEYADLTSDPQGKKEIEQELKRLAQKARAAGIHLIIATQKPSADVISTNLRSNLPAQLALRVKSATESRVIMDSVGAETLNGQGDAYFKSEGKLRRVQCARVDVSKLSLIDGLGIKI